MPALMDVSSVRFSHVAREWRCKFSEEAATLASLEAAAEAVLAELQLNASGGTVQRVVCGECRDFKVVTRLPAAAFGGWEGKKFSPEAQFL